jgi:hypothetical protein
MPKTRRYNKKGGFLENTTNSINSGINSGINSISSTGKSAIDIINKSANDAGNGINSGINSISTTGKNAIDTINKSANDAGNSIGNFFSSGYNKIFGKKEQNNYLVPSTNYSSLSGGKKTRRRKKYGGKVVANTNLTNIAANAYPVSGIRTAKPCSWVGGKTKRRRIKKSKSRRVRK